MRHTKFVSHRLLLLCSALWGGGWAAQGPEVLAEQSLTSSSPRLEVLTFSQLLSLLRQSPGWQSADLMYRTAQLQLRSAQSRAGLNLNASSSANLSKAPWDSGEWDSNASVSLSASLGVLPWSSSREALDGAQRNLHNAGFELRSARADLTVQLLKAVLGVQQARAQLGLSAEQVALAEQHWQIAQRQREQTQITQATLLERLTALETAQHTRAQAQRTMNTNQQALIRLLGKQVSLPEAGLSDLPNFQPGGQEADLLTHAFAARPEIMKAQASLREAQNALAKARREQALPDLTLSANWSHQVIEAASKKASNEVSLGTSLNLKTGTLGAELSAPLRAPTTGTGTVNSVGFSLSASYPLLGSGHPEAVQQAQVSLEQATLALDNARQAVTLDVQTKWQEYQAQTEELATQHSAVKRAEQVLRDAQARLAAGVSTALEQRQAEVGLKQAQLQLRQQEGQRLLATMQLLAATAQLDPFLLGPVVP